MTIEVDAVWQAYWRAFDESIPARSRKDADASSKIAHLALWVSQQTGQSVATWASCIALLDPQTTPDGMGAFVDWKRTKAPGRKWNKPVSVKRGLNILAEFFARTADPAAKRIADAMREYSAMDHVPPRGVRAWRRSRYPACWAGTLRLPRRAA